MVEVPNTAPRGSGSSGCLFLAMPPVAVVVVFLLYAVAMFFAFKGRPADGATVELVYATCAEAAPVMAARAEQMGLADAEIETTADGVRVVATLPSDPDVAGDIPPTLAQPGRFVVRSAEDGSVLLENADVAEAGVRMDLMMTPTTFVVLTGEAHERLRAHVRAAPDGKLAIWIDGAEVGVQSNLKDLGPGELEIPPSAENDKARMQLAARRGVVLNSGPLPCPAALASTTTVEAD